MPPSRTSKKLPPFMQPFEQSDFQGHFQWTEEFTRTFLDKSLFHACHLEELNACLAKGELLLRSEWKFHHPEEGLKSSPGVWVGMNRYRTVNRYGPCLMRFPMKILNNRKFMAFHRKDDDRNRIFFVQDESRKPVYALSTSREKNKKQSGRAHPRQKVFDPAVYFNTKGFFVANQKKDVYDIVLTEPASLTDCTIYPIEHNDCIPRKCDGFDSKEAKRLLQRAAAKHLKRRLKSSGELKELLKYFPSLSGETLKIKLP